MEVSAHKNDNFLKIKGKIQKYAENVITYGTKNIEKLEVLVGG